jgi:hypothetical protein
MNQGDPTDNALAAIASILDQTKTPPEPAKAIEEAPEPIEERPVAMPPPLPQSVQSQPIDEPQPIEPQSMEHAPIEPPPIEAQPIELPPILSAEAPPIEANGYSKVGPGPMAALRFKWTVREDDGRYYVDETVGEASAPLVNGPMDRDAAIKFVDDREAEARQRFEHFKQEMLGRAAAATPAHRDSDDEA